MSTMQTIIDRARIPLKDASKTRYSDPELLGYANAGIALAYQVRPDLRFGAYGTAFSALALGDTFPLPFQHEQTIADYATFRAQTKDGEVETPELGGEFLALFKESITNS
jgi:hypothetical protein